MGVVEDEGEGRGAKDILSELASEPGVEEPERPPGAGVASYSDLRGRERKLKVHIPSSHSSPIGGSIGSELNA